MAKEVRYFECDCGEGMLEQIAKTGVRMGLECGAEAVTTDYYECSGCAKIFARRESSIECSQSTYSGFREFHSPLTRQEIIDYASTCRGEIDGSDMIRIRAERKERYLKKVKGLK
ncbi:MAG: hypothetical protein PHO02_03170 [Candidatus Nanoarchaeia archaeon]|nr:hypothetical protein [Candidatus Nanoarchaeia archaeon]